MKAKTKELTPEQEDQLKVMLHKKLVVSLTLAESISILNNMLLQESEKRVEAMDDEEKAVAFKELSAAAEKLTEEN